MSAHEKMAYAFVEVLKLCTQITVFFALSLTIAFGIVAAESAGVFMCFLTAALPQCVMFLARRNVKNGFLFLAIHAVLFAGLLFISAPVEEKVAYVVVCITEIAYSIMLVQKGEERDEGMPIGIIILFVVTALFRSMRGLDVLGTYGNLLGFIFIILTVAIHALDNENEFISINKDTSSMPVKQIRVVNLVLLFITILICTAAMLIINNPMTEKMTEAVGLLILAFFRLFFRAMSFLFPDKSDTETVIPDKLDEKTDEGGVFLPPAENPYADILNWIFVVLAIVIVTMCIIMLIVAFIRFVKSLKSGIHQEDSREFINPGIIEYVKVKRQTKSNKDGTDILKVRKLYRNMVLAGAKKGDTEALKFMQPSALTKNYLPDDSDEATEIYERARYSNCEVNREDLQKLNKIRKKRKK